MQDGTMPTKQELRNSKRACQYPQTITPSRPCWWPEECTRCTHGSFHTRAPCLKLRFKSRLADGKPEPSSCVSQGDLVPVNLFAVAEFACTLPPSSFLLVKNYLHNKQSVIKRSLTGQRDEIAAIWAYTKSQTHQERARPHNELTKNISRMKTLPYVTSCPIYKAGQQRPWIRTALPSYNALSAARQGFSLFPPAHSTNQLPHSSAARFKTKLLNVQRNAINSCCTHRSGLLRDLTTFLLRSASGVNWAGWATNAAKNLNAR